MCLGPVFILFNPKVLPGAGQICILHDNHIQTHASAITANYHNNNDTESEKALLCQYLITSARTGPIERDHNGRKIQ